MTKWESLHVEMRVVALFLLLERENMTDRQILGNIKQAIITRPDDLVAYDDYFQLQRLISENEGVRGTIADNLFLRNELQKLIQRKPTTDKVIEGHELLKKTYLYTAKEIFADYMIYLEWNRPPQERFFLPRIHVMGKSQSRYKGLLMMNWTSCFSACHHE